MTRLAYNTEFVARACQRRAPLARQKQWDLRERQCKRLLQTGAPCVRESGRDVEGVEPEELRLLI
jgi:hypothetical protein